MPVEANNMHISEAIGRFEKRSSILRWQAWSFLLIVLVLLGFGGWIVFTASNLTARDVGGQDFDKRLENAQAEIDQLVKEENVVRGVISADGAACGKAYAEFFGRWPIDQTLKPEGGSFRSISFPSDSLPSGDEIAHQISIELQKPEVATFNIIGLQFSFSGCTPPNVFLTLPKARFNEVTGALLGREFSFERARLNSSVKRAEAITEQRNFLRNVQSTIYSAKVQAAASGNVSGSASQSADNNDLLLRLIQTSITRFGVLTVIGFLVSILVSLYRYNIRLSAFYTARADLLRLSGEQTTVSDFAILAAALTPQLEFGKTPPSPLAQLGDLIKNLKDAK
jgi:hypothetical protein